MITFLMTGCANSPSDSGREEYTPNPTEAGDNETMDNEEDDLDGNNDGTDTMDEEEDDMEEDNDTMDGDNDTMDGDDDIMEEEVIYPLQETIDTAGFVADTHTVSKVLYDTPVDITPYKDGFKIRISPKENPVCGTYGCERFGYDFIRYRVIQGETEYAIIIADTESATTVTYNYNDYYTPTGWVETGDIHSYGFDYGTGLGASENETVWTISAERLGIDPEVPYSVWMVSGYVEPATVELVEFEIN